jgi:hypothetical protein
MSDLKRVFDRYQSPQRIDLWVWFYSFLNEYKTQQNVSFSSSELLGIFHDFNIPSNLTNGKLTVNFPSKDRKALLKQLNPFIEEEVEDGIENAIKEQIVDDEISRLQELGAKKDGEVSELRKQNQLLRREIETMSKQSKEFALKLEECKRGGDSLEQVVETFAPTPPPPPPPFVAPVAPIAPAIVQTGKNVNDKQEKVDGMPSNLLDSIRKGKALKTVTKEETKKKVQQQGGGLMVALSGALGKLRKAHVPDEEEDSEEEYDQWANEISRLVGCRACGKYDTRLVPCQVCRRVSYCSGKCRVNDRVIHQHVECE